MRAALCLVALGLFGCGGSQAPARETAPSSEPASPPMGANDQLEQARLLTLDLMAQVFCSRARGKFKEIGAEGEGPATGRLWIRECEAQVSAERMTLRLGGLIWRWVDRSSSAAGAEFSVRQYVALEPTFELEVVPHYRYDREQHYFLLWLQPLREPEVSVDVVGNVDADAEGFWGDVVGFVAGVFGSSPDSRASGRVHNEASQTISRMVSNGITLALDLCHTELYTELGQLEDVETRSEISTPEPVRLFPSGLDAAGPFDAPRAEVVLLGGSSVETKVVCAETAHRALSAHYEDGQDVFDAIEAPSVRTDQGSSTVPNPEAECDRYVALTRVAPGESGPALVRVQPATLSGRALVGGCSGQ